MSQLKQKTISVGGQKQRIALKKKKNRMDRGGKYQYEIVDLDTGKLIEDPFTNKNRAMSAFNQTVSDIERGMTAAKEDRGRSSVEAVETKTLHDASEDLFPDDDIL